MSEFAPIGRILMVAGLILLVLGALVTFGGRVPRLPGDIVVRRDTYTIYIPLVSSLLLSILLTVGLSLLMRR